MSSKSFSTTSTSIVDTTSNWTSNIANTTTNNTDRRMVVDGQGIGISSNAGANVTVNSMQSEDFKALLATTERLAATTQQTLDKNVSLAGQLTNTAAAAYRDAADNATANKPIYIAGLAVLGLVALTKWGKA